MLLDGIFYTTGTIIACIPSPCSSGRAAVWVEVAGLLRQVEIALLEELFASAGRR